MKIWIVTGQGYIGVEYINQEVECINNYSFLIINLNAKENY